MVFRVFFFFILTISLPPFLLQYPHCQGRLSFDPQCMREHLIPNTTTCLSSLRLDPNSAGADTMGLARIMIGVAAANATATSSLLSSMVVRMANDTGTAKLLKECADKYSRASDALQAAAWDLKMESHDYAYVHVTAGWDYPIACHNLFRRNAGSTYQTELTRREDGHERLWDVIMGIIDFLGY